MVAGVGQGEGVEGLSKKEKGLGHRQQCGAEGSRGVCYKGSKW